MLVDDIPCIQSKALGKRNNSPMLVEASTLRKRGPRIEASSVNIVLPDEDGEAELRVRKSGAMLADV